MSSVLKMNSDNSLRNLQLSILDIALEFKRICEKYNINYFLIGGTLLGAVRHQGFIPWDDDMDVGMLRNDYERFLEVCPKELGDEFFLQTNKTDDSYTHPFAKIRINDTLLVEDYAQTSGQHNGVYLDVFPYDNMPDNKFSQKLHYILFKCFKWAAMGKNDYVFIEKRKRVFSKIMKFAFFFLSKKKTIDLCVSVCKMFNRKKCENVINMGGAYNYSEYALRDNFENLTNLSFEGYYFSVPSNYEMLLTNMYGDFMKLPPEEKRGKQHNMVKIDISRYKIKNSASK